MYCPPPVCQARGGSWQNAGAACERGRRVDLALAQEAQEAQEPSSVAVVATALIGFVVLAGLALRPLPAMPRAEAPAPLSAAAPAIPGHAFAPGEARHNWRPLPPCRTARICPS